MKYIIKEKFWHLAEDSDILDENEQPVYQVKGNFFSIRDMLIINDLSGNEVARVYHRLLALTATFEVEVGGQRVGEMRKHFFSLIQQQFSIDTPEGALEMDGDLFSHEFTIDREGETVATVSKRWFSLTSTFGVDIAPGQNDLVILACVLALDLALDEAKPS